MNNCKTADIRNSLVKKMDLLLASADDTIKKLKTTEDKYPDPFDQAALESSKNVELSCRIKDFNLLLEIKETILRIDNGLFGICDHCGRPISPKRLRVAPMSKLCVDCQEERETRKNITRRGNQIAGRFSYDHA
jgi:DnaK suppressor protein